MDAGCLAPVLFRNLKDCPKIVSDQRRVIEVPAVGIGPLEAMIVQCPREPVEINRVVCANGVVGNGELQKKGQERTTDYANAAKIALALHRWNFSSFGALLLVAD